MDAGELLTLDVGGDTLGGPDPAVGALCATLAIRVMQEVAGAGMRMTSMSLDVTSHPLGEADVSIVAKTDKRARSIVFVSCEARADGRLVFSAQGLFGRAS